MTWDDDADEPAEKCGEPEKGRFRDSKNLALDGNIGVEDIRRSVWKPQQHGKHHPRVVDGGRSDTAAADQTRRSIKPSLGGDRPATTLDDGVFMLVGTLVPVLFFCGVDFISAS